MRSNTSAFGRERQLRLAAWGCAPRPVVLASDTLRPNSSFKPSPLRGLGQNPPSRAGRLNSGVRAHMKHLAYLLTFSFGTALAGEPTNQDVNELQKRLDFVANIQKFQGMFDSVTAFCGSHVPAHILD